MNGLFQTFVFICEPDRCCREIGRMKDTRTGIEPAFVRIKRIDTTVREPVDAGAVAVVFRAQIFSAEFDRSGMQTLQGLLPGAAVVDGAVYAIIVYVVAGQCAGYEQTGRGGSGRDAAHTITKITLSGGICFKGILRRIHRCDIFKGTELSVERVTQQMSVQNGAGIAAVPHLRAVIP